MDKIKGIIPPHFLYYLEKEKIQVFSFSSTDFQSPENYDKAIVKFPFANSFLDIQIIFDQFDYSVPPDFILLNDTTPINYAEVIKNWKFKDSNSLYDSLHKIKEEYSKHMITNIKHISTNQRFDHREEANIAGDIIKIIEWLQVKIKNYTVLTTQNSIDVLWNAKYSNSNARGSIDYKFETAVSYPLDILEKINDSGPKTAPRLNMVFNMRNQEGRFDLSLTCENLYVMERINNQISNVKRFKEDISIYEGKVIEVFRELHSRQSLIKRIIDSSDLI